MDSFHDFVALLLLVVAARAGEVPGAECGTARYQRQVAWAVSHAASLKPDGARAALESLQEKDGEEGLRGHPVLGALYAVRAQGLDPQNAVYCAGEGGPWVGVATGDGRVFRLPLGSGEDEGAVELSRLAELPRPAAAARPPALDARRSLQLRAAAAAATASLGSPVGALASASDLLLASADFRDALRPVSAVPLPAASYADFCAGRRCRSRRARATIDTDGFIGDVTLRAVVADPGFDKHHRPDTDLSYSGVSEDDPAHYLDATRIPYVVKHRDSPWRVGDLVVVEYGGRRVAAIVGDSGRRRRINEISYAAAERLAIDSNGNSGGTGSEDPVTVTALRGLRLRPENEGQLLATLDSVQRWLDAGMR